jgi:hypothetical protein
MGNKFRNETEIVLGETKILLRPTFENIAAMESTVGSVAWLGWKYSRGIRLNEDGKPVSSNDIEQTIKALPPLTEAAKIIYFNQAEKTYSQDEIWDMVQGAGIGIAKQVVLYLAKVTSGNKTVDEAEATEGEKKS